MAEIATLARPYANALFDLARGDNALNEWSDMLSVLLGVVEEEKVEIFLEAPENSAKEKALRLSELCGEEIDDRARKLLLALAALILFLFLGRYILSAVGISESILTTVGGVILFLIALRMVFPPLPVAPIQRMSMRAQMSPFLSPWPFLSLPVPLHLRQSFFS